MRQDLQLCVKSAMKTKKMETAELVRFNCVETNRGSFESVIEQVEPECIKGDYFEKSKRKAGCCSLFTYQYANTLVESVNQNKGRMDPKMIEAMNSDPKRDEK